MTAQAKIVEGRSRILNCLALCGAEQQPVMLLLLQKTYFENYGSYLNLEEIRAYFGEGHIKQIFEKFMKDDVAMTTNPSEIGSLGSLYLQLKRPLAEALAAPLFGVNLEMTIQKNICAASEDMANLFDQGDQYSDCILVGDGKEFNVYKGILACRSPVFAAMFQNNEMIEAQNGIVQIVDIRSEVLEQMLLFIYTGKPNAQIVKTLNMEEDLLIAAEKYELIGLKEFCENMLADSLTNENACDLLVFADFHFAKQLKAEAIKFIKMHAKMVTKTEGWKMLLKGNNEDLVDQIVQAIIE